MLRRRTHPLDQSRLYKLGSKSRLVAVLGLSSVTALEALIKAGDANYRTFTEPDGREIQHPVGPMVACHKRLETLLSRIEVPDYVHSKKGRSYISHALAHANGMPVAKTDVSKYFPSTSFAHVLRLFAADLKCPKDVAWILTKLCTYGGHIPTGSQFSTSLAFLANRPMFDRISEIARKEGCLMTSLMDDIVISGPAASKRVLNEALMEIRRWGLRASPKRRKTKTYPASAAKVITGVIVKGETWTLPNRRRKKMEDACARVNRAKTKEERSAAVSELRGRINEAEQVNSSAVQPRHRSLLRGTR